MILRKFSNELNRIQRVLPVTAETGSPGADAFTYLSEEETVRERVLNDRVKLFCVHCQDWERTKQVKRVPEQPSCPNCDSTMIAALHPWADDVVSAVKSPQKDTDEERATEKAYRRASLVQSHGRKAIMALTGRGVGPETAARIINNHRDSEDEFYRDILRHERRYARTKAFWD